MTSARSKPKARKSKAPVLHDWRVEVSAFGPTLLLGTEAATGEHRTLILLWWADGRFGTEEGVFKQGFEDLRTNLALEK
jgi:hypothetical protein